MNLRPRIVALLGVLAILSTACTHVHVWVLADDSLDGRQNGTAGSQLAQNYIVSYISAHAEALDGTTTPSSYLAPITAGTNVVAQIPGTDLADEIVLVGAHYDHIGDCDGISAADSICNGATDNAAGVGILLEIARALNESPTPPRRTVMFAFWDREEDGLIGSAQWVANNPAIVADIVTYVNYDIQGANLLPSLRDFTIGVGAETGGDYLRGMVELAGAAGPLDLAQLSAVFGQGRSDYQNFLNAGVPTVFFTDSTGPCYHTVGDDVAALDADKLGHQRDIGLGLVAGLANQNQSASLVADAPLATYADAQALRGAIDSAQVDLGRFTPAQQSTLLTIQANIGAIVDAGPGAFDQAAISTLLGAGLQLTQILSSGPCESFQE